MKSSYGDIVSAWDEGVQTVAICHEAPSLATKLHHGRFRANGGCGFVPLPARLRSTTSSQTSLKPLPSVVTIHIIGGRNIPLYVASKYYDDGDKLRKSASNGNVLRKQSSVFQRLESLAINNLSQNKITSKQKDKGSIVVINLNGNTTSDIQQQTKIVLDHGHHPVWNEVFSFSIPDVQIGQITFRVYSGNSCTAFASIPLHCLRPGYRSLELFQEDRMNNFVINKIEQASLFVRVKYDTAENYHKLVQDAVDTFKTIAVRNASISIPMPVGSSPKNVVQDNSLSDLPPQNPPFKPKNSVKLDRKSVV